MRNAEKHHSEISDEHSSSGARTLLSATIFLRRSRHSYSLTSPPETTPLPPNQRPHPQSPLPEGAWKIAGR
ncbi:hypothetical protein EI77_03811 [Prosthecobacter fusiformis]|uniref:Uncharacterized protein n=1 Tax=Prosthecobacter fusiformis TaxID=48464 RepID=A0A4R7RL93_9BACT|nr:hypothetical protein EI77_03811 [Prosthecobacter fusiformis]